MKEKILEKLSTKVEFAEVYYIRSFARDVKYKGWKLNSSSAKQTEGVALRVVKDGRMGFSATTDPDAVDELIANALATAKFGEQITFKYPEKTQTPPIVATFDKRVQAIEQKDLIDAGAKFIENTAKHRETCDMEFSAGVSDAEISIANLDGMDVSLKTTNIGFGGELARVKDNDVFMIYDYFSSRAVPESISEEIDRITENFDEKLAWADNICTIPSGRKPIVFDPRATLVLLYPLLVGINGDNIHTGASPIADKIGDRIFDPKLTLIDDGTIDLMSGSRAFDDEGLPKRRLPIVENGVLQNFLFDLKTAAKAGYEPNGCAERSLFSPPAPSSSNIILGTGDTGYNDMIADIADGLLIESVLGMGQGNLLSGAFSNPVAIAFKIENGTVVGRVKDAQIAGNIYDLLTDIAAVGSKGRWFWGEFFAPHVRMDNIEIVG